MLRTTAGNGVRTERGYDIAGRLKGISVNGVMQLDYGYGVGSQTKDQRQQWMEPQADTAPGVLQAKYEYSSWGQWKSPGSASVQAEPPARPMKTRFVGGTAAETRKRPVDARGQLIVDGERRYRYNGKGRLIGVSELSAQGVRELARYTYNAWGERVSKTVFDGNQQRTSYFLYEAQRIAAGIDGSGVITSQYLYMNGTPYAKLDSASPTGDARTLYIHTDARGLPLAMTDEGRHIVWRSDDKLDEQAWGRMQAIHAPQQAASGWQRLVHKVVDRNAARLNLRLPGQYLDEETGLHYNYQRYYDPRAHAYLSPDPLGYAASLDAYGYVGNDPINKTDPLGLYESDVHYYMTFFLAITAGVDKDRARTIALAAQYVDDNPATQPINEVDGKPDYKGSLLTNAERVKRYHFVLSDYDTGKVPASLRTADFKHIDEAPQLQRLLAASDKADTRCAHDQFFGEYLHAFEDTFSHRNPDDIPIDATIDLEERAISWGHGRYYHDPDYTYNHRSFDMAACIGGPTVCTLSPYWPGLLPTVNWGLNEYRTLAMETATFEKLKTLGDPKKAVDVMKLYGTLFAFNAIHENGENTDEFGAAKGAKKKVADSAKIRLLNAALRDLGYSGA